MDQRELSGILPPIPTPFDRSGGFDAAAFAELVSALLPAVDGLVVLGSNGEAALLDPQERERAVRIARDLVPPDKPLIVGSGAQSTRATLAHTAAAAAGGADLALVLPPHYYRGQMSDTVLERHYRTVADASPIPLLLYNIPAVTGLRLGPPLIARLSAHPRIVGLKDSSGDVGALTETMRLVPGDFVVLSGHAPTLLAALTLGARGGILALANVAPRACGELIRLFSAGDLAGARALQLSHNELALAVTSRWGVPALKAAMRMQGLPAGFPRAPLLDIDEQTTAELRALLQRQRLLPVAGTGTS